MAGKYHAHRLIPLPPPPSEPLIISRTQETEKTEENQNNKAQNKTSGENRKNRLRARMIYSLPAQTSKFKTGSTSASRTLVRKQKRHNSNKTSSSLLAFTILGFLSTGDYKQSGGWR
jgi:hypothetical protein